MKVLFFLILSLPLAAFARVDYNCTQQNGNTYGLAIGSSSNELAINFAMGGYLKGNVCNGNGQCVFTSCFDSSAEYWIDQSDYDASQRYNQCLAEPGGSYENCRFDVLPESITVTEKKSGDVVSTTRCVRRDLLGQFADPQN